MDLGVQTIDLAMWLLGFPKVESLTCHMHRGEGMEVEDGAALLMRLHGGAALSLTVSWSLVAERDRHYMRLLGTRGSGAVYPLAVYKEVESGGLLDVTPAIPPGRENIYTASYRAELSHFVAVARGEEAVDPPREQAEIMKLVALAYRSAEEKREVEVV